MNPPSQFLAVVSAFVLGVVFATWGGLNSWQASLVPSASSNPPGNDESGLSSSLETSNMTPKLPSIALSTAGPPSSPPQQALRHALPSKRVVVAPKATKLLKLPPGGIPSWESNGEIHFCPGSGFTLLRQRPISLIFKTLSKGQKSKIPIVDRLRGVPKIPATPRTRDLLRQWITDGTVGLNVEQVVALARGPPPTIRQVSASVLVREATSEENADPFTYFRQLFPINLIQSSADFERTANCSIRVSAASFYRFANTLFMIGVLSFTDTTWSPYTRITADVVRKQKLQSPPSLGECRVRYDDEAYSQEANGSPTYPNQPVRPTIKLCVITRNRARLLIEFIQYHRLIGVDQFIVLDDHSSDNTRAVLEPFQAAGVVILRDPRSKANSYHGPQMAFYHECVAASRRNHTTTEWIGLLDTDEFIVLNSSKYRCIGDAVAEIRYRFPRPVGGALAMPWRHVAFPKDILLSSTHTIGELTNFSVGAQTQATVKSIVDPKTFFRVRDPHSVYFREDTTHGHMLNGMYGEPHHTANGSDPVLHDVAVLHYKTTCFSQFFSRNMDGRSDVKNIRFRVDLGTLYDQFTAMESESQAVGEEPAEVINPGWPTELNNKLRSWLML